MKAEQSFLRGCFKQLTFSRSASANYFGPFQGALHHGSEAGAGARKHVQQLIRVDAGQGCRAAPGQAFRRTGIHRKQQQTLLSPCAQESLFPSFISAPAEAPASWLRRDKAARSSDAPKGFCHHSTRASCLLLVAVVLLHSQGGSAA